MVEYETERESAFVRDLAKAHKWRYTLDVGTVIDARNNSTKSLAAAGGGVWREGIVVEARLSAVVVHFLGWSTQSDATIDRVSSDIQPLHTFTAPWRDDLREGSVVEVRTLQGDWEAGEVSKIDKRAFATGSRPGEPNDPRAVLLVVSKDSGGRWVDIDGEDICQEDTHLQQVKVDERCTHRGSVNGTAGRELRRRRGRGGGESNDSRGNGKVVRDTGSGDDGKVTPSHGRSADHRSAPTVGVATDPSATSTRSGGLKRVALVGSSGGGAAALGQLDGLSLLTLAKTELRQTGIELAAVQFVACADPLDSAPPTAEASLWVVKGDEGVVLAFQGTLSEVNALAKEEDAKIAAALLLREGAQDAPPREASLLPLHGLVAISCDVGDVNRQAFTAARERQSPIVGTGGSSLGTAMAMGCLLVGSSGGSVATTNKTKVVSYAAGLAGHWRLGYDAGKELTRPFSPPASLGGCLPSFVGVMVAAALCEGWSAAAEGSHPAPPWVGRLWGALPVVAAAVAARQVSSLADTATAAGIIAGSMVSGDIMAALVAGTMAGFLCSKITAACLQYGVPATSLSLYATTTSGVASGAIVGLFLPFLGLLGKTVASTDMLLDSIENPTLKAAIGAGMGCTMCYGSKVGWYHRFFLPVIVLELGIGGGGSIWGAIDLCALCMVAAGLCAAHLVRPAIPADVPLAKKGLIFNVFFGDFVEAANPFMERCRWCNLGAYLGAACSGAVVAVSGIASSAYIPLPLAYVACEKSGMLVWASCAAFGVAFVFGVMRPMKRRCS